MYSTPYIFVHEQIPVVLNFDLTNQSPNLDGFKSGLITGNNGLAQKRGFAAEISNHLYDKHVSGKNAEYVGTDFVKNGPDRIVNNVLIQTKYCASGRNCIRACISNGKWRYPNQLIEVPHDAKIYKEACEYLQKKLDNKEIVIPGVTNAKQVIKRGKYTLRQANLIAKSGKLKMIKKVTIDRQQVIICTLAIGLSAVVTISLSLYSGKSLQEAIEQGIITLIMTGGEKATRYLVSTVLHSGVILRALNEPIKKALIQTVGYKGSASLVNPVRSLLSMKPIYGAAAMNNLTKMVKMGVLSVAVEGVMIGISTGIDLLHYSNDEKSGLQVAKNVVDNTVSSVGGLGGASIGAVVGSALLPGVGTVIGGIIGGFGAGLVSSVVSSSVTSIVIKSDTHIFNKFVKEILEKKVESLAIDYLLIQKESNELVKNIMEELIKKRKGVSFSKLRDCFSSLNDHFKDMEEMEQYAEELLVPYFEKIVAKRKIIDEKIFSAFM